MNGKKMISSIFDYCHETASQEVFLRSCGAAQPGVPPQSDPSVAASPPLNSPRPTPDLPEADSVIHRGTPPKSNSTGGASPPLNCPRRASDGSETDSVIQRGARPESDPTVRASPPLDSPRRASDSSETDNVNQRGVPPEIDPSVAASPPLNFPRGDSDGSEADSKIGSGFDAVSVESQPIRFVSPPETPDTVDSEEDPADRTVPVESNTDEDGGSIALEKSGNRPSSSSGDRRDGGKKLKVPLRDVVKAIVMNSRNTEEEEQDKEIEKMSCVQILMKKGFKFP